MKINKLSFLLIIGLLLLTASSCANADAKMAKDKGNGTTVSKTVNIGDFDEIDVATGISVIFSQSPNPGTAKVETSSAMADRLVVRTDGKTLKVYFNNQGKNMKVNGKTTTVTVSSPVLSEIEASSSGSVTVAGDLNCDGKFSVEASSSGSVELGYVACRELDVESSSAGEVNIGSVKGDVDAESSSSGSISIASASGNRLEAEASSAGSVKILGAVYNSIEVEAGSAASVSVKGIKCGSLVAEASSAGKVVLEGKCRLFRKNANSAGKVHHSDLEVEQ